MGMQVMNPPLWGVVGGVALGLCPWGSSIFHPESPAGQIALSQAPQLKLQLLGKSKIHDLSNMQIVSSVTQGVHQRSAAHWIGPDR